jgi:hypothetical protein
MTAYSIPDPTRQGRGGTGDANVIRARHIAPLLNKWVDAWNANRPNIHGWRNPQDTYYGPCQWLSDQSGVTVRQISRIKNGDLEYVSLNHADALLQAMDAAERLDVDIPVIRNPRWTRERWHAYMAERGCA